MIFVAAAHRGDGQRFVVRADEKLTAFAGLVTRFFTMDKRVRSQRKSLQGAIKIW